MFTALILVCAGGIKDPGLCLVNVHPTLFPTYETCATTIATSINDFSELFEFRDEQLQVTWKITDIECLNWNAMKV